MNGSSIKAEFNMSYGKARPRRKKAPSPISVRFSEEERKILKREAGKQSLSTHIRMKVLGDKAKARKSSSARKQQQPKMDFKLLAQLLGTIGQSELGRSLLALSLAAQSGSLPVDDDLTNKLNQACDDIKEMRSTLIVALGIKDQKGRSL